LSAQEMSFTTIQGFVALSVAFGVASVLIVSVIQRSQDIGILRAMGATQSQMLRVFLLQGGILGGLGSVAGSSLGIAALAVFHALVRLDDGSELFPLTVRASLFVWSILLATVTGIVAAALPAVTAARLDPVDAIRG
jgi:lipoprotein-releasing system permease protein